MFDSALLAKSVDGVLMVVAANQTPRKLLGESLNMLDPAKVLGIVFNRTSVRSSATTTRTTASTSRTCRRCRARRNAFVNQKRTTSWCPGFTIIDLAPQLLGWHSCSIAARAPPSVGASVQRRDRGRRAGSCA